MEQVGRPVSPQSQHESRQQTSTAKTLTSSSSSSSPVSPHTPESPMTALPQPPATGNASLQTTRPPPPTRAKVQRPPASSYQHKSKQTYEIITTAFSPSTHELTNFPVPNVRSTVRKYDRYTQRWRLWNLVWLEWAITVILCVALFGLLHGYSRHDIEQHGGLTIQQKHIFNTLATVLSIFLGLNLAGSLRSYVKILRWRLLATRYRPLTEFELILGCERQTNLVKLMWKVRNKKYRFLPSVTQLLCLLWLACNFAAAVLVSMLGLTYSINQSVHFVSTTNGRVSVVDFNPILRSGTQAALILAQTFALSGGNYLKVTGLTEAQQFGGSFENVGSQSRYWFNDLNPDNYLINIQTDRYIDGFVSCEAFPVVAGVFGNESSITYQEEGRSVQQILADAAQPGSGGVVAISDGAKICGNRCTSMKIFQAETDPDEYGIESSVQIAQMFVCNVTISQVQNIPTESYDKYLMSDKIARILAGVMGWSGSKTPGQTEEYHVYPPSGAVLAYTSAINTTHLARQLSEYSIGAVANMDDWSNGNAPRQTIAGIEPGRADFLQVVWWHAGTVLILIPWLQLASLMAVIAVGNRAIIKDDSYLAVAKLYKTTIDQLGDHGCVLRGDEIIEALKDDGREPKVIYGWKETARDEHGVLRHVDVFDDRSGMACKPAFEEGRFDGSVRRDQKLKRE